MHRQQRVVAGLAVLVMGALAGCGASSSGSARATNPPGKTLEGHSQPLHQGSLHASDIAAADTAFGFDLFAKLCTASPSANLTLSPASAAQALGMLDTGAVGKTQAAIARMLHLPAWSSALVAALHDQTAALAKVSQVTVTNHVYEQTGVTPTQATLNDLQTAFNSDLHQLDFAHDAGGATNTINQQVSKDTAGMIPKLFDQPLDPSTQTVLADAILLDAKWQQPFTGDQPGTFHAPSGAVQTPMMTNDQGRFASRTSGGWQSVVLPYVGGALQAVAILPPATATGCATPDAATMTALTSGTQTTADAVLPKLDLSQTLSLTQVLASLGLPLEGDYTGLGSQDDQISEVVQKVVMQVNKAGTKAAAATGVGVTELMATQEPPTITFNRPFLLVLQDTATHTPLFVTRVVNPTQQ